MSKLNRLQGRLVYPGDRLSVIEEFLEGPGSYQRNGVVRSEELGLTSYSIERRMVAVSKHTREPILPKEGMDVVGEVGAVQRRMANVDIFIMGGQALASTYTGVVHVSSVDGSNEKNLSMAVRGGDIVRARIINTKNRMIQLSIEGTDYGVVYAFCSRCGTTLEYSKTRLHCPSCGRAERRKTSNRYGKEGVQ